MSFFEQPPPHRTGWQPPAWDRPSEAVLGAVVPLTLLLGRNEEYAYAVEEFRAYPNGFTCNVVTLRSPLVSRPSSMHSPMPMHPMMGRGPRIGFEFSDGSRALVERPPFAPPPMAPGSSSVQSVAVLRSTTPGPPPTNMFGVPVDDDGMPVQPFLTPRGGGGGGDRFALSYWCYPLPPPGEMTIHADWPDQELPEVSIPFDADRIRDAARDAITLWEPDA